MGWQWIGYEYDRATQQLQPAPDEGDLVCDMYQLAVKFRNATEVAKILNETGKRTRQRVLVRTDGSQRVVGEKRFIGDRVKAILGNPIYSVRQETPDFFPGWRLMNLGLDAFVPATIQNSS